MGTLSLRDFTRRRPSVPASSFEKARKIVLPSWDISLVFAGPTRAKALNQSLRQKTYTPNVLSYKLGTNSGEIIICPSVAKKQAPRYGLSYPDFVLSLFIHGLFHLKGLPHGPTMEKSERATLARVLGVNRTLPPPRKK